MGLPNLGVMVSSRPTEGHGQGPGGPAGGNVGPMESWLARQLTLLSAETLVSTPEHWLLWPAAWTRTPGPLAVLPAHPGPW